MANPTITSTITMTSNDLTAPVRRMTRFLRSVAGPPRGGSGCVEAPGFASRPHDRIAFSWRPIASVGPSIGITELVL